MQECKEVPDFPKERQGFFVKIRNNIYQGPFNRLKEAREDAKKLGSDMEIYHGVLRQTSDKAIDARELFLVPKTNS
jgi:hypothetical protein